MRQVKFKQGAHAAEGWAHSARVNAPERVLSHHHDPIPEKRFEQPTLPVDDVPPESDGLTIHPAPVSLRQARKAVAVIAAHRQHDAHLITQKLRSFTPDTTEPVLPASRWLRSIGMSHYRGSVKNNKTWSIKHAF